MKQVNLTLNTAKLLYKSSEAGKAFALDNYTKEELEAKEFPKTWEELNDIKGCYVSEQSGILYADKRIHENDKNIFVTAEQAKASIAMAQLSQLMAVYNDEWIPDYTDNNTKHVIYYSCREFVASMSVSLKYFLAFKTAELRDEFLKNFKDLIEQAKPLL